MNNVLKFKLNYCAWFTGPDSFWIWPTRLGSARVGVVCVSGLCRIQNSIKSLTMSLGQSKAPMCVHVMPLNSVRVQKSNCCLQNRNIILHPKRRQTGGTLHRNITLLAISLCHVEPLLFHAAPPPPLYLGCLAASPHLCCVAKTFSICIRF